MAILIVKVKVNMLNTIAEMEMRENNISHEQALRFISSLVSDANRFRDQTVEYSVQSGTPAAIGALMIMTADNNIMEAAVRLVDGLNNISNVTDRNLHRDTQQVSDNNDTRLPVVVPDNDNESGINRYRSMIRLATVRSTIDNVLRRRTRDDNSNNIDENNANEDNDEVVDGIEFRSGGDNNE